MLPAAWGLLCRESGSKSGIRAVLIKISHTKGMSASHVGGQHRGWVH